MDTIIGGHWISSDGKHNQLPIVTNPSELNLEEMINVFSNKTGVFAIKFDVTPKSGPYELVMYADSGRFLVMLNEYFVDGEHNVRTLDNPKFKGQFFSIYGDSYSGSMVTDDINYVFMLFKKFLANGNIPELVS